MRSRISFLAGLAVGFVAGTRAGRERYEQMVKLSRKVVEHPAVQNATRTAGSRASELSKAAGQKAAETMPKIAERPRAARARCATGFRAATPATAVIPRPTATGLPTSRLLRER